MSVASDLKERVFKLSDIDRAELARDLILSLEHETTDANVDLAWEIEILARADSVERGDATPTPWRDAVDRIKKNLSGPSDK